MITSTPDEHSGMPVNFDPTESAFTPNADPATEHKGDMARFIESGTTDPAQLPLEGEARDALLAQAPDNLDADGNPHFLLMSDRHAPRCGYCGEAWPCAIFQEMEAEQRKLTGQAGQPSTDAVELVNLDDVAAALGMTRDGLDAQMAARVERDMAREDLTPKSVPDTGR